METVRDFIFLGSKITADGDYSHEIKRHLLLGSKAMRNLYSILKSRAITLLTKVHYSQDIIFPSSWMWELDHKESWAQKNWCFQTVVLEKAVESPLGTSEGKSRLFGKDPDAGKDWGQGEKGITEDKIVAWFHWLNRHEFEQTLRDSEGQGTLECCSSWDLKESNTT